ncbi:hypothetical protein Bca4012_061053 [Brassica carinata]|uniref:Uncharacterized protein n=1 Tax=Brassica carinata TaxID=52824 RepID=A0A8X7SEX8_BRACI|nr:hypothetical protein Bca52824_031375 [Brassica carinata]
MVKGNRLHRLDSILIKMVFRMTIYHVWRERNARRHQLDIYGSASQDYRQDNAKQDCVSQIWSSSSQCRFASKVVRAY